ncbi:SNF2-related protein [Kushneria aurantia]|uniref:SNF2-related protein n=1 Tax=Kushneria aurantia TaxID=504092 RepID=A0ABV6G4R4_9GAMM|nr:SNF2-related protein [Kushneria aurantia]
MATERITDYHAKYFAYELTRQRRGGNVDRLAASLFDASVDLNPHQIDAALFALQNPLAKGVLLADEVGLGKTIEAALVICQYWAERRRRLVVIAPAALRKQWASELAEKFHLPTQVLDARAYKQQREQGIYDPLDQDVISVMSYHFAARLEPQLRTIPWDLVVVDEAHKLRNAHRESHRTGQAIKRAFAGSRKLLLTATPLQNSLLELYGLSTVIDGQLFGDAISFRRQFMRGGNDIEGLRRRLDEFAKRTLRRQVLEYVQYTERKALTIPFTPSRDEQRLYHLVSGYLEREDSYGVPTRQRHLVSLVIRKLLASSTTAIIQTLETLKQRLESLHDRHQVEQDWLERLLADESLDEELLEAAEADEVEEADAQSLADQEINPTRLQGEIAETEQYLGLARSIHEDAKSHALVTALETGFARMDEMRAPRKAVVFTESRRTLEYLSRFLERHGFADQVATFSGTNNSPSVTGIYQRWLADHAGSDRVTGSPAIDRRTAIIDHFRDKAQILVATEAAAEGVNLQFCNLVVNYDLPWNPQRVEQRIGRCHRYGQQFDVVVVNFLNQRNEADKRVLELLSEKFQLFDGLFGASDEILGRLESGVDVEKRIADIYATCRTPDAIEAAFAELREQLEADIDARMRETESKLLEHFDEQIHELLRIQRDKAEAQLDRTGKLFWKLTRHCLSGQAKFNDGSLTFHLEAPPVDNVTTGDYWLIRKGKGIKPPEHAHVYRLTHPLGEYVLDSGRRQETPAATLRFQLSDHPLRISVLEQLTVRRGWMELNLLELDSFQHEEHLVFTALADDGTHLDQEACERLFNVTAEIVPDSATEPSQELSALAKRQLDATLSRVLEENHSYFQRERDKLEAWSDDQIASSEAQLEDTRAKIKDAKRRSRTAETLEEQKAAQEALKTLERQQRRDRQAIFDVQDEIEKKRDALIDALERQMHKKSQTHRLFRIRWELL